MEFRFSRKISSVTAGLAIAMIIASYWQYTRHQGKLRYIQLLGLRLESPITPIKEVLSPPATDTAAWNALLHRRLAVSGRFDFEHEMVLRNRRLGIQPGVYAITPLRIEGTDAAVLVSRGFIPLPHAQRPLRARYQNQETIEFVGLVKESLAEGLLAPRDPPTGPGYPWVDAWLRVNIPKIQKQLPYKILPVYLEIMESGDTKGVEEKIISSHSGRDEIFMLQGGAQRIASYDYVPDLKYPVPVFDTVVPPGRHRGYIFEWAFMALITLLMGFVLQLRRPAGSAPKNY